MIDAAKDNSAAILDALTQIIDLDSFKTKLTSILGGFGAAVSDVSGLGTILAFFKTSASVLNFVTALIVRVVNKFASVNIPNSNEAHSKF